MRHLLFWVIIGLGFANMATAQSEPEVWPLWPEGIPCANNHEIEIKERGEAGRMVTKVHEPILTVYQPKAGLANGTGVVICPGGGYYLLAWDKEGIKIAEWFNSLGITAFVLQYRLPHWETQDCRSKVALMDAQRAIRMVRDKASAYQVDPAKVGIMGFSAGGHLASTASTHFDLGDEGAGDPIDRQSCRPDFSILMYPVISFNPLIMHKGSRNNLLGADTLNQEAIRHFSNEHQVSKQTPPTLLIHATNDKSVPPENSLVYYQALRKHGIPAAMHIYEDGGHGFGLAKGMGGVSNWPEACEGCLRDRSLLE